ncbi:hypothetical protein A6V39_03315 [Candidatus Mycoplasma haematobovis]|uniref:Uncharacterized protein n=1 Tax=Candidatus Mycoplasma haematobovis TaxID=432608 RepID=A0A1A9QCU4_9MOLU|nr:hypothetical protein [Candidatus Mycoplasma haematobovis]OAL09914.1 hypothetical protein A6V39_03315 [Candidatus Mycoplasma haematobovis]
MPIPASLSKLKSLFPVFVVGASVAITIKLLTESTPLTSEILQVKAEEDIKSVDEYKDDLVPDPEPEPPQEETPPPPAEEEKDPKTEEQTKSKEEEDSEEKIDSEDSSKEENQEDQKKDQSEQKPKSSGRAFISGGIGDILKQIMKPSKK